MKMGTLKLNDTQSLYGYSNLSESNLHSNTVEIGTGLPKTKSHLKVGNLIIHNTHRFNWLERKMWKLFFGFDIENVEE
jgi:hypothetical protein